MTGFSNKRVLILLVLLIGFINSYSQQNISPRLIREYPSVITRKVFVNLLARVPVSEGLQIWMADQYVWQDSVLQAAFILDDNIDVEKVNRITDSTNWVIEYNLINRLSEKELTKYRKSKENERPYTIPVLNGVVYMDTEMDSQFGKAIQIGQKLNLKDSQYVQLIKSSRELKSKIIYSKSNPDSGFFDRPAFESEKLAQILSEKQYNDLLVSLNLEDCVQKAKYAWYDIKTMGLSKKFNQDTTLKNITMYYMLREHITGRYAYEKEKRAQMLGALKTPEPLVALQEAKSALRTKLSKYAW